MPMNQYGKYEGAIERISLTDATFAKSTQCEIEPTYINFFYGNNGTGKSTIARTIRKATERDPSGQVGAGLTWKDGKPYHDFSTVVFNRDFVERELNFDTMHGVFMLSEERIGAQEEIDKEQVTLDDIVSQFEADKAEAEKKKVDQQKASTAFSKACWSASEKYRKAFGGNKGDFFREAATTERILRTTPAEHSFDELKKRFDTATDPNARRYDPFGLLRFEDLEKYESFALLGESIVSTSDSAFNRFMQSIDAVAWVQEGHQHYAANAEGKCPYCQQPITGLEIDIEAEIEKCFSGKYSEDCTRLASYQQKYSSYTGAFIQTVQQYVDFLKSLPKDFGDVGAYELNLAKLQETVTRNNHTIASKVAKPSEEVAIESIGTFLDAINALIAETNKLFNDNNAIFAHQADEQTAVLNEVWELLAFDLQETIRKYHAANKAFEADLKALAASIKDGQAAVIKSKATISRLAEKLGGCEATIQKINELLIKSGFHGFSLQAHDRIPDKYVVIREDGSVVDDDLSEGERNFIAFLYFYHLVHGSWKREDLVKGKIVVIDDPVSSMDSSVLSIVSSLVRELINDCFCDGKRHNIRQVFVLTHNPYFHNAVSQEMLRPEDPYYKKVAFFEVKKGESNISTVSPPCTQTSHSKDPDITYENYSPVQNSYTALWQEYKDAKLPTTLLHIINRIVDYHFILLCSYDRADLKKRVSDHLAGDTGTQKLVDEMLRNVYEPPAINESIDDMIYFPAPNNNDDYKEAFRTVFKAIGQESHYAKMSGEGAVEA
jgi:wobble nucleotide-excising tRNase